MDSFSPHPYGLMRFIGRTLKKATHGAEQVPEPAWEPGEKVLTAEFANRLQSRFRVVNGMLYMTDRRLVFSPNMFDARHEGKAWAVPLLEIAGFRVVGRIKWVDVELRGDLTARFVLRPADETAARLRACLELAAAADG